MAAMSAAVSVSTAVVATPEELWALVSDITRMGDWSPETTSGTWIKGATGPAVGARFKGDNRHGKKTWSTVCEVTECEAGAVFAFDAMAGPIRYANWRYEFEATDDGALVTESMTDRRGRFLTWIGGKISGVTDRRTHNEGTMTATLEALAAATG
jgi:ligand-binding SRPBCC domain-containing protein